MSKNLNISVLVAARDEYIEQLKCIICPLINQGFMTIYNDAFEITNGKNTIYKFQELLKAIPTWNQTILQNESKRIKKKCPYIMDIVTAIFVSNVKILASIRLSGESDNIKVKIPTSELFIHSIYIESAHNIFYDPFLFYHRTKSYGEIQKNKESIVSIIRSAINETIRQMLPFDNILQEYLKSALNDNISDSSDSESSDSDSETGNLPINKIINNDLQSESESLDSEDEIESEMDDNESELNGGIDDGVKQIGNYEPENNQNQNNYFHTSQPEPEPINQGNNNNPINQVNNNNSINQGNNNNPINQINHFIPEPINYSTPVQQNNLNNNNIPVNQDNLGIRPEIKHSFF